MAASKKAPEQKQKGDSKQGGRGLGVALFAIIIIVVVAGGLVYGLNMSQQGQTSIAVFEGNFDSAARVSVLVTAYNGTTLAAATGCATGLIEQLTATHGSAHKNASMISFYVINSTKCVYAPQLGSSSSTYSNSTPGKCINMSRSTPSIFINYSDTNRTVITPDALYVSGTTGFLSQCGVASEITAT
jgi:hypothetical protein